MFLSEKKNKKAGVVRKQDIFYHIADKSNTDDSFFNLKYLKREKLTADAPG